MGWYIAEIINNAEISDKCAEELFEAQDFESEIWYAKDDVVYNGRLNFDPDHMEHMDYVWKPKIQEVLKKHNVKGDICFGSLEGDNFGSFWGYRFDGKGGMQELEGMLSWYVKKQ